MRQNEQKRAKMSKKEQKRAKMSKKEQKRAKMRVELEFNCYIVCGDWIRWFFVLEGLDPRGFSCNNGLRSEGFLHATQRSTEINFISIEDSATLRTKALCE